MIYHLSSNLRFDSSPTIATFDMIPSRSMIYDREIWIAHESANIYF